MKRAILAVFAAPLLAAGCAMQTVSTPHDTFAELNLANPAYRDLSVALVYSQNTKIGMDFSQGALTGQPGFQPNRWFSDMVAGLGKVFKRTMLVETVADARATNADLIAVVDDLADFNRGSAKLSIKLSAIFLTPDQKPIDVVVGMNDPGKIMWTHGAMADAARLAQDRFDKALFASAKLADFARDAARGRAAPAPAVAAPPAAEAPASDIDSPPPAREARPHSYAVAVGVEHYREKLPNADFSARDARLAAEYFERVLGVPAENVALLTEERATKSDFEKYFERWLPNRVEAGDTVYVYYSGHGAPDPAKGDAYLVPYDADPTYIEQTGYPLRRLFDDLAKLPAKQVYVAMDSCFSGAGGRSVIAKGARPLVSVAVNGVPANVTVLSASAGDQISNSYQEKGHGLFTYFFLKGLAEKGGDLRAAFDYLKPEVARVARREYNSDQQPQWREGR